ncbi:DUF421 domain-containing protein [Staphylococcus pseudoxylosus]|uniref:DUF421 domain-containing protein n=1 Tax=Staphylococcus pseudoxylosus TaxID=2282419 RepID=UPI00193ADAC4|nr:YetF domain-containing protein [Staphylococcus pseudoxylosus]MBM2659772.1 DUF421 domain-containing protein [Staphylococcus pseudoxylosus]
MLTMQMTLKLIVGFITILIIIRLLGKRNLAQLTPGDIVYFMVFGGILEESLYDNTVQLWQSLLGLITWGVIIFLFEFIISKSRSARKWLRGDTSVLINKGKVNHQCLKSNRLEIEEIISIAREKGIFDLSDIKNMYIESDGGFSIETYMYQYPISEDDHIIYPIIENQTVNKINLEKLNKNHQWLLRQLSKRNIKNLEDVFYADWAKDRGIFILQYEEKSSLKKGIQ